jgi:hypothetical protein
MLLKLPRAVCDYGLTDHLAITIDEWAQVEPEAVARFLDLHKDLPIPEYGSSFVKAWAGINAADAWKWLEAHSENTVPFGVASWLNGWFRADPEAATNYALAHTHDNKFADAVTSLAPELFQQDERKAKAFIAELPTSELRQGALTRVADLWSPTSLNEWPAPNAAAFIVQFSPAEWPKNFSDVLGRWRDVAASELVRWISELPPQLQVSVIDRFPAPSSFEPEQDFLPILKLRESNIRSKLLQHMVQQLGSEVQSSPKETLARLKLSPDQKAELAAFLPRDGKQ